MPNNFNFLLYIILIIAD